MFASFRPKLSPSGCLGHIWIRAQLSSNPKSFGVFPLCFPHVICDFHLSSFFFYGVPLQSVCQHHYVPFLLPKTPSDEDNDLGVPSLSRSSSPMVLYTMVVYFCVRLPSPLSSNLFFRSVPPMAAFSLPFPLLRAGRERPYFSARLITITLPLPSAVGYKSPYLPCRHVERSFLSLVHLVRQVWT